MDTTRYPASNPTRYVIRKDISESTLFLKNKVHLSALDIELTERCNNACQHCYINLPEDDELAKGKELTTEDWKNIIHQAADLGAMSIRFTGGEPLIRPDFREIYTFTRRLGIRVMLFTNARKIDPDLAALFKKLPPGEKIEVSVYGMRPETYDAVACKPGAFEEFWQGINLLMENEVPFVVKSALLPDNQADMEEFETWAESIPWMDKPPSYAMYFDLRARHDSANRNRLIKRLRSEPGKQIDLLKRKGEKSIQEYREEMVQFCDQFMSPPGNQLFRCGAGTNGNVDAYGNYQPCLPLRAPELTHDLRKGSLRDALDKFFPSIREMEATNPDYLERCAKCFLKGLCEQCPAKSWMEHGDLDTPVEYLCQVAHQQAIFLGLLEEGEKAWEVINWQERITNLINQTEKRT